MMGIRIKRKSQFSRERRGKEEYQIKSLSRGSSQSKIEPRSPTLQGVKDSLPSEPLGKPENTRVGSLSLLQGNFLTQESNQGLLHHKWILYQVSYQGNPIKLKNR